MDIKEYTSFLVKSIVKNPDMVKVEMFETEGEDPIIEIIVHHDDFGSVIGKGGYAFLHKMPKVKVNIDSF